MRSLCQTNAKYHSIQAHDWSCVQNKRSVAALLPAVNAEMLLLSFEPPNNARWSFKESRMFFGTESKLKWFEWKGSPGICDNGNALLARIHAVQETTVWLFIISCQQMTDQNIFIAGHRKVPLSRDPPCVTSSCQRSKCKKNTGTACHFFVLSWELNHIVWLWKKTALYTSPIMQRVLSWPQLPIFKTSLIPCCREKKRWPITTTEKVWLSHSRNTSLKAKVCLWFRLHFFVFLWGSIICSWQISTAYNSVLQRHTKTQMKFLLISLFEKYHHGDRMFRSYSAGGKK